MGNKDKHTGDEPVVWDDEHHEWFDSLIAAGDGGFDRPFSRMTRACLNCNVCLRHVHHDVVHVCTDDEDGSCLNMCWDCWMKMREVIGS